LVTLTEFRIEVNALNYATGKVLSMKCSDEMWRPITFISKSLSDTERNYEIHDKEMCKGITHRQPLITLSMSGEGELK